MKVSFDDVTIRYPRAQARSIAGMMLAVIGMPVLMLALGAALGREPPSFGAYATLALMVACGVAWASHGARKARLDVDDGRLMVAHADGVPARSISNDQIESAIVVSDGGAERLHVTLKSGEVLITTFKSGGQAREALAALDLAHERRTRLRLASAMKRVLMAVGGGVILGGMPGSVLGAVLGLMASPGSTLSGLGLAIAAATALLCAFGAGTLLNKMAPELTIGADGLAVRVGGRTRFVAFEQIAGVGLNRHASGQSAHWLLSLDVEGATTLKLAYFDADQFEEARAIVDAVEQAIAEHRGAGATTAGVAQLEPGGRPVSEWLAALRELGKRDPGYRSSALSREQLLGVLDDPAALSAHRLGAAVVLSAQSDESSRERIRIAAQSSANPKLSGALDAIAQQEIDESALAEAIAEHEADQARA